MLVWVGPALLFVAFLLLLLVSLSVPIIKSIFLFRLVLQESSGLLSVDASGSATFGVWGYCLSALQVSALGLGESTEAECSRVKLGYTFDSTVTDALHVSSITNAISEATTGTLVLHLIACGLTFITLGVTTIFFFTRRRKAREISPCVPSTVLIPIATTAATIITLIVFLFDVGVVAAVRHDVSKDSEGLLTLSWGNGVWMVLVAAIMSAIACGAQWSRWRKDKVPAAGYTR
ncbi:hypothetical protein HYDPIDRAFT_105535 [Hydnomerulius pinastri MD-312]|nr:hypothetical protein HYDPIDRAFT_105535 [Hydnomerulius pinastri MD-312]